MRARAAAWVFAVACALAASASSASAAPPSKPRSRQVAPEAREDYETARALFARGDFKGCVEALERAQKASPDPLLFWNSAACEKKLGHYAKAIGYVERYLLASGATLSEEERKDAAQFLDAARAYVGRVSVSANIEGVQVFVDGDLVGTTPLERPIVVDGGERSVRYARSGYEPIERTEKSIAGAELRWAVDLAPSRAEAYRSESSPPKGPSPSKGPSRLGPILVGSVGVVAAGVGASLAFLTVGEATTIEAECGTACPPSRWEKYRDQQLVGDVLLGAGGALVVGAVVWWLVTPSRAAKDASVSRLGRPFEVAF